MPRSLDSNKKLARRPTKAIKGQKPVDKCLRVPVVKKIAHRALVRRISHKVYEKSRTLLENYLRGVLKAAVLYCENRKRQVISHEDMRNAIKTKTMMCN